MQKVKLHPFHMSKRHPIITFDKYTLLINTKQARLIPQKNHMDIYEQFLSYPTWASRIFRAYFAGILERLLQDTHPANNLKLTTLKRIT